MSAKEDTCRMRTCGYSQTNLNFPGLLPSLPKNSAALTVQVQDGCSLPMTMRGTLKRQRKLPTKRARVGFGSV